MNKTENYEILRSWGEALRRRRTKLGFTTVWLSTITSIPASSLTQYEREAHAMSVIRALKICQALDWTIQEWEESAMEIYRDGTWLRRRWVGEFHDRS